MVVALLTEDLPNTMVQSREDHIEEDRLMAVEEVPLNLVDETIIQADIEVMESMVGTGGSKNLTKSYHRHHRSAENVKDVLQTSSANKECASTVNVPTTRPNRRLDALQVNVKDAPVLLIAQQNTVKTGSVSLTTKNPETDAFRLRFSLSAVAAFRTSSASKERASTESAQTISKSQKLDAFLESVNLVEVPLTALLNFARTASVFSTIRDPVIGASHRHCFQSAMPVLRTSSANKEHALTGNVPTTRMTLRSDASQENVRPVVDPVTA